LRIEFFILKAIENRRYLLRGIIADSLGALHEQTRLLQNLVFLFRLKDRRSHESKQCESQSSDSEKH
jgi:hypothetical protein